MLYEILGVMIFMHAVWGSTASCMMQVRILSVTLLLYQILGVMIFMHTMLGFHSIMYDSSKYPLCNSAALPDPRCDDLHALSVGIPQSHP